MRYKCIIFDCDGVLVDSEAISNKILVDMFKTVGYYIDIKTAIDKFSGLALKKVFNFVEKEIGKDLPDDFETIYRKLSYEAFKTDLEPIEGVHSLLDRIETPYCVASSGPLKKIKLNLTVTKLMDKFEGAIFSCYEINSWKPEPNIFLHAAKIMGFQPNECVVIEDSLAGVTAAKAGGFDVFVLQNESNRKILKDIDVPVFTNMNQLDSILTR